MNKKKYSMINKKNGKTLFNQYIIEDDKNNTFFQSYLSVIVKIDKNNNVFLDSNYWNLKTVQYYRNLFLNETTEETRKKIKSGLYKLINLN